MKILLLIAIGLTVFNTLCITRFIVQTESRLERIEFRMFISELRRKRVQGKEGVDVND